MDRPPRTTAPPSKGIGMTIDGYETESVGLPPVVAELALFEDGIVLVNGDDAEAKSITIAAMTNHERARATAEDRTTNIVVVGDLQDHHVTERALELAVHRLVLATCGERILSRAIRGVIAAFPEDRRWSIDGPIGSALIALITPELVPTHDRPPVVAAQVLVIGPGIRGLIWSDQLDHLESRIPQGSRFGNQTMASAYAKLVDAGRISEEVASERSFCAAKVPQELPVVEPSSTSDPR